MLIWIVALLGGLIAYFVYDNKRKYAYWKEKGIPTPKLTPVFNCLPEVIKLGAGGFDQQWTKKLGRTFGYFEGPTPTLVTSDLEMLKHVMVKDFLHFVNRRDFVLNGDVLGKGVSLTRDQHWKDVRSVLLPAFTSGKLRQMNVLIHDCCKNLELQLDKLASTGEEFEAKELYGRLAMDVIASAFFGTKIDSQNEPDNAFITHTKAALKLAVGSPLGLVAYLFPKALPYLKRFGFQFIPKEHIDFFVRNTEEIIKLRKLSNQTRKDFLQLMVDSQERGAKEESRQRTGETPTVVRNEDKETDILSDIVSDGEPAKRLHARSDYKLDMTEVVAQAVVFFLAGYETTAAALSTLTYCMALNPDIQEKLREEIQTVMQGKEQADYDALAEMEYLDQCVNEGLRLYPTTSRAERQCNQDWEYKGLKMEKGTVIGIPIFEIQRDPEYWPDPEVYDPERFSKENRQNIKPYSFMAFGQGPRNCIGMRFALYELKMVMVTLLRKFRVLPCTRTEVPLQLSDLAFLSAKNGVWVKLEKI